MPVDIADFWLNLARLSQSVWLNIVSWKTKELKQVKSLKKKMSKTRNGKSDFGIFIEKKVKSQSPGGVKLDLIQKS